MTPASLRVWPSELAGAEVAGQSLLSRDLATSPSTIWTLILQVEKTEYSQHCSLHVNDLVLGGRAVLKILNDLRIKLGLGSGKDVTGKTEHFLLTRYPLRKWQLFAQGRTSELC